SPIIPSERPRSLFGGPFGPSSDREIDMSSPRSQLGTIREHVPTESSSQSRHRELSDVGSPERGTKSARIGGKFHLNMAPEHTIPKPKGRHSPKPSRTRDDITYDLLSGTAARQPATDSVQVREKRHSDQS